MSKIRQDEVQITNNSMCVREVMTGVGAAVEFEVTVSSGDMERLYAVIGPATINHAHPWDDYDNYPPVLFEDWSGTLSLNHTLITGGTFKVLLWGFFDGSAIMETPTANGSTFEFGSQTGQNVRVDAC